MIRAAIAVLIARARYFRYLGASGAALAADLAVFLTLTAGAVWPGLAAAIGYSAGIGVHWLVSSRAVFIDRVASDGPARRAQQALFVASALAGLAVTFAIVSTGAALGLDARLAKLVAIAVSFQLTYLLRAKLVFA